MTSRRNNKNIIVDNTRNFNNIIEEVQKKIIDQNNLEDELNYFHDKIIPFGKYKNKSLQSLYIENYNYCIWLSNNIQDPKYDLFDFIQIVKKYQSPKYNPKNHH